MSDDSRVIRTEYSEIMKKSYIDYAMSVIIARALPDVRDGLKPVQRRTLYDMHELGIRYDKPYRKCARIVGDTMGKYHPHGDSSIYEALVVMAQPFKKGVTLVDGHGNFGSIEGDGAAAMRYTEARLTKYAQDIYLADLDKDIVEFGPNFDENEKEPTVLPSRLPNLLINGADGIAVGMATSIPTHNLTEVASAVKAYIADSTLTTRDLMHYIKGPDFPTGGIIANKDDLPLIYETGQGRLRIRGKIQVEEDKRGKKRLVITEIPYTMIGAGIGRFLNDVAGLVESRLTTDVTDISNQSSKEGIRIVLELRKGADVENLKNLLYKKTRLEDTFGVNMLAVADGRPETLGLKDIISYHVDFLFDVTTRKYDTLLKREREKSEVQEGLIKACDIIDLIIEILRGSKNIGDAKACLTKGETEPIRFRSPRSKKMAALLRFTDRQAQAILDMRLYRLIGLEMEALIAEHNETLAKIASYEDILQNYDSMADLISRELDGYIASYGRKRRTVIANEEQAVFEEAKPKEQEVVLLMDRFGYVRTVEPAVYERNKEAADEESRYVLLCMNTSRMCLFTREGRMHQFKVADIPYGKFRDKGVPVDNISNFSTSDEEIIALFDEQQLYSGQLLFSTRSGMVKIVCAKEFIVSKRTTQATKLAQDDRLVGVQFIFPGSQIVLQTKGGYFLRFADSDVSVQKKTAMGVRGIRLQKNDEVTDVYVFAEKDEAKAVYKGKEITLTRLKLAKRDQTGTKTRL